MLNNFKKIPQLFFFILKHWLFLKGQKAVNNREMVIIIGLGVITVFCEALGLSLIIPIFSFIENSGDIEAFKNSSILCKYVLVIYSFLEVELNLFSLSIAAVFFTSLRQICNYLNTVEMEKVKWVVDKRLQIKIFNLIMGSTSDYIQDFKAGHLANITSWEIPQVSSVLRLYNTLSIVILTTFAYVSLLFFTAPKMTALTLIFVSFLLFITSGFLRKTKKISESNLEYRNKYREFINERFYSWKLIRLYNNQKHEENNINSILANIFKNEVNLAKISGIISLLFISISTFSLLITINIFVSVLAIKLSIILTFGIAFLRLMPLMTSFQSSLNRLIQYYPSCIHLEKVYTEAAEKNETIEDGETLKNIQKTIEYKNVYYSYSSRNKLVLQDINFSIKANSFTAIMGHSGAGKSTIVDMLTGLIKPDKGQIFFDSIDMQKLSLKSIRSNIAYVPQEPVLFRMTLADNMRYANEKATDEDLWKSLKLANIDKFIAELPDKLDTDLGSMGSKLSGGQRQRIILARTFLAKPSVLILDEPTSALDKQSDEHIQDTIANIQKELQITIILIAHRMSSLKNVDYIINIDNGKIKKLGKLDDFN